MIFVALLAEGVDRNCDLIIPHLCLFVSPSSRRAWIEISKVPFRSSNFAVALLAEGVDRNLKSAVSLVELCESPSSRRAWIEISF